MANGSDSARRRTLTVFLTQGCAGLLLMLWITWLRFDQTTLILHRLQPDAAGVIVILIAFATILALLKFELTELIFVSLVLTAYTVIIPILGVVISSWLAVLVAGFARVLALKQIGPAKIESTDRLGDRIKTFGLFGTYGIPVVAAATLYEHLNGELPLAHATFAAAVKIALCGVVLSVTNILLMFRVAQSYGYSLRKIIRIDGVDFAIYLLTVPYAVMTAISFAALGWSALVTLAFSGSVAIGVARNFAKTRIKSQQQLQRIASLTNIGKTISLRYTTEELLDAIYNECKRSVDCTLFTIALLEESTNELSFELDVRDGVRLPKDRIRLGEGLNSWVASHHEPLLIGSVADEKRIGVRAVADTKPTESWLGVPMIARDRLIGVISVESFNKNAFTNDDMLLLTAIANQAAVAIENAHLYKDLEGLTYALEQRVLERTNELRETNLRLLAADRSKNQFLANMSHELRTPLNSIIGFSSVLLENTRAVVPQRLYKFLENIHVAGNHLLELINDILDLSKIEAGKMELRTDDFDLRDTITAVERVMKGFAAEARVSITASIDPSVPMVRLDEGRLKQILFNLLSNAVKFSPDGGPVTIAVKSLPRTTSPLAVDSVRIDVADRGIGIPPDQLQRIFDEFYQTEEGRRARRGGTGLGLSLTRNFVELHHGRIEVQSVPGEGSCFTLYLPVNYDAAAATLPIAIAGVGSRVSGVGGAAASATTPDSRPPTPVRSLHQL
ncbi:MAG: GAF domain-containing protein [Acidobacteria bacterium]|nr:GAF domain-containing protein [Acidobacteriota bacterium]MBV9188534.1 GAF domain-containing protein [Acidobacteriota bacterium]